MRKVKVINLARAVGPTNMHWNDLYSSIRKQKPGLAYPPVSVEFGRSRFGLASADCAGVRRKYFHAGVFRAALLLARLGRNKRVTLVVHIHMPSLAVVVLLARLMLTNLTVVVTQHNRWSAFRIHQKLCFLFLSFIAKEYVVCGASIRVTLPKSMEARLSKKGCLSSIPNGVPSDRILPYAAEKDRALKARSDGALEALVVARMTPQKNGFQLLRLIANLPQVGKVTWYGDGPLREDLKRFRDQLALTDRVIFAGMATRESVYKALSETDLYLTMSLWEGLSVADLEAVSIGCFALMSDIPERREIANVTGVKLLPFDDVRAWSAEIDRYLQMNNNERRNLCSRYARLAQNEFSLEKMVLQYREIYERVA